MERKYVKVRPSREKINVDDIVSHLSGLHKLGAHESGVSLSSRLNPFDSVHEEIPFFEFLITTKGKDREVEFLFGTAGSHVDTLKNRLMTAYPTSFDVEIVEADILKKTIPPERYGPKDFVKKFEDGDLIYDMDAVGTPEDISGGSDSTLPAEDRNPTESADGRGTPENIENEQLDLAGPSENTQENPEGGYEKTDTEVVAPEGEKSVEQAVLEDAELLDEIDSDLLSLVDRPTELDASPLEAEIDGPQWTKDGDILARPTLEHGEPIGIRWNGHGERKKDWMTTITRLTDVADRDDDEEMQSRAPLAGLIQEVAESSVPVTFQVLFQRVEDWSTQAKRRKDDLHLKRDTLGQKVRYEVGELLHGDSRERRQERARDNMQDIGESADRNTKSPVSGEIGERRKHIDNKIPKKTFRVNIRAISVVNDEIPVSQVEETMRKISTSLDHLDGYYYGTDSEILRDTEGRLRDSKDATEEFHRLVNRELVTGSGKIREDMILNPDELACFTTIPNSEDLTVEGARGARAEAESRDPLPKPDADLMKKYHQDGMRVGYALDKQEDPEPVPTQIPPDLLDTHYARFAKTGAGKSKSLINDMLSLYENTDGPIILIDPKGDGMAENYMQAHYERFGEDDFKDSIIHYSVPDILPGFTFFDISKDLQSGKRRSDAIQNKADHYQELLRMVMGRERYEEAKVAPTMISAMIKTLFDEEYVEQAQQQAQEEGNPGSQRSQTGGGAPDGLNADDAVDDEGGGADETMTKEAAEVLADRESPEKFTHRHLEKLTKELRMFGTSGGEKGSLPDVSNQAIRDTLEEQAKGDSQTFSQVMNGVFNRINYIREDEHLRQIFNNTNNNFDFRDHLNDNKVILFDLGELRDDATMVMSGLILTNLWDALQASDRKTCQKDHDTIHECRQAAKRRGLNEESPPCREPWDDDHLVNLIIDEAPSVAVSRIMNKMLEQGRSFHLSVGLAMQFPGQMREAGSERVYQNVLNNVGAKMIGKIDIDEDIAKAIAHEGMDIEEFDHRIKSLPPGEWIAQLPSPGFRETGPEPFSLKPLPIPAGHPESTQVLTPEAEQRYNHIVKHHIHRKSKRDYGVTRTKTSDSPTDAVTQIDDSGTDGGGQQLSSGGDGSSDDPSPTGGAANVANSPGGSDGPNGDFSTYSADTGSTNGSSHNGQSGQESSGPQTNSNATGRTTRQNSTTNGGLQSVVTPDDDSGSDDSVTLGNHNIPDEVAAPVEQQNNATSQTGSATDGGETATASQTATTPHSQPPQQSTSTSKTTNGANTTSGNASRSSKTGTNGSAAKTGNGSQAKKNTEANAPTSSPTTQSQAPQSESKQSTRVGGFRSEEAHEIPEAAKDLPIGTEWDDNFGMFVCEVCESQYGVKERQEAIDCCRQHIEQSPDEDEDADSDDDDETEVEYKSWTTTVALPDGSTHDCIQRVPEAFVPPSQDLPVAEATIESPSDLFTVVEAPSEEAILAVLAAVAREIPSHHHRAFEWLFEWVGNTINNHDACESIPNLSTEEIEQKLVTTRPAAVMVDSHSLLASINQQLDHDITPINPGVNIPKPVQQRQSAPQPVGGHITRPGRGRRRYHPTGRPSPDPAPTKHSPDGTAQLPAGETIEDHTTADPVSVSDIPDTHLANWGIDREDARFLRAVVKAMNNDLPGYDLLDSMKSGIASHYDVDVKELMDNGLLKIHQGSYPKTEYYSVTTDGQDACKMLVERGDNVGDLGDDTPHRVGARLAEEFFEQEGFMIQTFPQKSGEDVDAVVRQDGQTVGVVEIEGGRISKDPGDGRVGINNDQSIVKDYDLLEDSPGKSIWVVRNNEVGARVMKHLKNSDRITADIEEIEDFGSQGGIALSEMNGILAKKGGDGLDRMLTYKSIRQKL